MSVPPRTVGMNRRTVGFPEDLESDLRELQEERDLDSFAEAVRAAARDGLIVERSDYRDVDALLEVADRAETAEARADDLRRQLREANRRHDDVEELVAFAEDRRHEWERHREASIVQRARWWLFGARGDQNDE